MKKRIREISTVILVVVVLTTIPALAGGSIVDLPVWVTQELKHSVKFVSREFGFSAYFCAPVKQTEENLTHGFVWEGVRYRSRQTAFLGFDKDAHFATVVHKVKINARIRLADFSRAETNS